MDIQKKIKEHKQLQEKVKDLEQIVSKNKQKSNALSNRLYTCETNLKEANKATGYKKKGIIFLLIAVFLLVVEILLLTEVIKGYSDFSPTDIAYILAPASAGFAMFFKMRHCQRNGTSKKIQAEIDSINKELAPYLARENELSEAEEKTGYHGKYWDFSTKYAWTPEQIAELEEDFVDLLIVLKHKADASPTWLVHNAMNATLASLHETEEKAVFQHNTTAICDSNSWILKFLVLADAAFTSTVLLAAVGADANINLFSDFMLLLNDNFRSEHQIGFYADKLCLTPKYLSQLIKQVSSRRFSPKRW